MWWGQREVRRRVGAEEVKTWAGAWYKALQAVGRTLAFILSENNPGFFQLCHPFRLERPGSSSALAGEGLS